MYIANKETKSDLKDRNDFFAALKDRSWVGFCILRLIPGEANVYIVQILLPLHPSEGHMLKDYQI